MQDKSQKNAFLTREGDDWYIRNKKFIDSFSGDNDPLCSVIEKYKISGQNTLEIGCSAGYRLQYLKNKLPNNSYFGVDPSSLAINYGKALYPEIKLSCGTIDNLSEY